MPDTEEYMKIDDPLRIWRIADETDPLHTKPVTIGRKMTAIDSYYQIKRATEAFGPMGQGWGYDSELVVIVECTPPLAMISMNLWYIDPWDDRRVVFDYAHRYDERLRVHCPTVRASNRLTMGDDAKPDEECFKKATTDALTKSLSYLGFSADVFLGKFDDQKYVLDARKRFETKRAGDGPQIPDALQDVIKGLPAIKDLPKLEEMFYGVFGNSTKGIPRNADLVKCNPSQFEYIQLQFKKRKAELDPVEPPADLADAAG